MTAKTYQVEVFRSIKVQTAPPFNTVGETEKIITIVGTESLTKAEFIMNAEGISPMVGIEYQVNESILVHYNYPTGGTLNVTRDVIENLNEGANKIVGRAMSGAFGQAWFTATLWLTYEEGYTPPKPPVIEPPPFTFNIMDYIWVFALLIIVILFLWVGSRYIPLFRRGEIGK